MTTPIRRQYLDLKKRHPGAILFFRLGDFYETFDEDAELVTTGIESVAALMQAVLWSGPAVGDPYEPAEAERDAYRDALARTDASGDIFTRHYGAFEGRTVVAHCPGAPYARALLESAWRACTGTPPPA